MKNPELHAGEKLLAARPDVGFAVYKSGINYRIAPSLPVLQSVGFYITDRRAILRGELFMSLYDKDVDFWLPGHAPAPGDETITEVSADSVEVLGQFLRIATIADRPHVLREKTAAFQIFTRDAQDLLASFPAALRRQEP